MSVLVACPTRGRVWYETAMSLVELAGDIGDDGDLLFVQNDRSVLEARNEIVATFLEGEWEFLMMIDDDVVPPPGVLRLLDHLDEPRIGIAGAPCPIVRPGLPVLPNIFSIDERNRGAAIDMKASFHELDTDVIDVDAIGFGCVAIVRELVERLGKFQNRFDPEGKIWMGEDIDFCMRAHRNGFAVVADLTLLCDHMITVHAAGMAATFAGMLSGKDL